MSYPNYPDNRLVVNGVDLTERFGLILLDGYTLTPPTTKTYVVDIPGGNGKLDLTESLLGDVAFDNRKQEFVLCSIADPNFEQTKTEVSNFLHGKAFDYTLSMDPNYTYHGRFTVSAYESAMYHLGIVGSFKVSIDADPFKHKPNRLYDIDAIGGITYHFPSGRESVCPVVISQGFLKVIFKGKLTILHQGTWSIDEMTFKNGENEVYFNTYDIHNLTWGNLITNSVTWGTFKQRRLYEWYKSNGDINYNSSTWYILGDSTWQSLSHLTWRDLLDESYVPETVQNILVKYEWGDL